MRDALADIATKCESLICLKPRDTVLDIGCNDGTLLASYTTPGIYRVGFDPAANLATVSRKVADKVVADFFTAETYSGEAQLRARRVKIATSIAMFYDLEEPGRFVSDVRQVLDPEGLWVIEMRYLPLMLEQNAFDNICHEHLEYYSLQSLQQLLGMYDMRVVDVETNDVNGGSFRVYIRSTSARDELFGDGVYRKLAADRVTKMLEHEEKAGLGRIETYREFVARVERIKELVVRFIRQEKDRGKVIYVYGPGTKGNTILQYFGLDNSLITAAAERNSDKWGLMTVGTHIPIVSEEEARAAEPDYLLVLPWHFIKEFKEREKDFLARGGRFIVPLPEFTLI